MSPSGSNFGHRHFAAHDVVALNSSSFKRSTLFQCGVHFKRYLKMLYAYFHQFVWRPCLILGDSLDSAPFVLHNAPLHAKTPHGFLWSNLHPFPCLQSNQSLHCGQKSWVSIFQNWPFGPDLAQIWPRFGQGLAQIWPKLCPFDPFCHWCRLK